MTIDGIINFFLACCIAVAVGMLVGALWKLLP
jgi:hypothetical protein